MRNKADVVKLYNKYKGRRAEAIFTNGNENKTGVICGHCVALGRLIMAVDKNQMGWMHSTFSDIIIIENKLDRLYWYVDEDNVILNKRERLQIWINQLIWDLKKKLR